MWQQCKDNVFQLVCHSFVQHDVWIIANWNGFCIYFCLVSGTFKIVMLHVAFRKSLHYLCVLNIPHHHSQTSGVSHKIEVWECNIITGNLDMIIIFKINSIGQTVLSIVPWTWSANYIYNALCLLASCMFVLNGL